MVGLVLTLLWSAWQYYHGVPIEGFWLSAVNFLFWWYVAWAILMGLIYLVLTILMSLGLGASGFENFGPLGGALGLIGGGCAGIFMLGLSFLLHYGCLIFGTVMLREALVGNTWNIGTLVFGLILVAVGLFFSRSSGSKKTSE